MKNIVNLRESIKATVYGELVFFVNASDWPVAESRTFRSIPVDSLDFLEIVLACEQDFEIDIEDECLDDKVLDETIGDFIDLVERIKANG